MFDLATTDESATDVEITEILKQLNDHQKQRVINFAKIQLAEQQNKITEIREKSMNLPDTLAAHADDPRRTYSDKELADINNYLDAWIDHEENKKK
ncbi:cI repressor [Loigolactobacillus coryniformis subsp. torquens DSM 20004 = KCTC 3535]|nr:cI repressor [Loigolactobacillus coryniformis subsp. torquens DSM 20004 = KCTC 3535]